MEGGYEEYRLLQHYQRDYQKDAKILIITTILVIASLACASGFEVIHVDVTRPVNSNVPAALVDDGFVGNATSTTTVVTTTTNTTAAPTTEVDRLTIYVFYRCLDKNVKDEPDLKDYGRKDCKLVIYGEENTCKLEEIMMYLQAAAVAAGFLGSLMCLIATIRTLCTRKNSSKFLWVCSTLLVLATFASATGIIVIVAADNALCSTGSTQAAASLPNFAFGPGFWLLVTAAPVFAVGNAALSFQSC
jgi:hypothetical protein